MYSTLAVMHRGASLRGCIKFNVGSGQLIPELKHYETQIFNLNLLNFPNEPNTKQSLLQQSFRLRRYAETAGHLLAHLRFPGLRLHGYRWDAMHIQFLGILQWATFGLLRELLAERQWGGDTDGSWQRRYSMPISVAFKHFVVWTKSNDCRCRQNNGSPFLICVWIHWAVARTLKAKPSVQELLRGGCPALWSRIAMTARILILTIAALVQQ